MERVNQILKHEKYLSYLIKNEDAEKERIFCRHNMGHFLDVARLAVILNQTEDYGVDKALIYGAALLHDIGRWMQYESGISHEKASVMLAPEILDDCGFSEQEKRDILKAIGRHRDGKVKEEKSLSGLIYRADKLSRPCYACPVEQLCDWKQDKKNKELVW